MWTILRRHAARRHADACSEQQDRGACHVSEDNNADDDDADDDDTDDNEGDDDDEHSDNDEGDDDDEHSDIDEGDDEHSDDDDDCHHHFQQHRLVGSRSDRSQPKSGDDDGLNGFDEIVITQAAQDQSARISIRLAKAMRACSS